ncbi:MAG: hypothetical protein U0Z53_23605 [Blastocatellia bacterium]
MKTYKVRTYSCPRCQTVMDCITSLDGRTKPQPGHATFCINCGGLFCFDHQLRLRPPTPGQLRALQQNADTWARIELISKLILEQGLQRKSGSQGE